MKKITLAALGISLVILLAACGSSSEAATAAATPMAAGAVGTPGPGDVALSGLTRLLVGTLALEDTDLAVSPEQALALLPIWQAVQALSNSDTAASAEMTALEEQIKTTLTLEQMAAVDAMPLTRADMQAVLADLGLGFVDGTRVAPRGTPGVGFGPGDFGGGFPGGNPQNLSPEQQATLQARRASGAGRPALTVPPALLTALIDLLKSKVP